MHHPAAPWLPASPVQAGPSLGTPAWGTHTDQTRHHHCPVAVHQDSQVAGQSWERIHQLWQISGAGVCVCMCSYLLDCISTGWVVLWYFELRVRFVLGRSSYLNLLINQINFPNEMKWVEMPLILSLLGFTLFAVLTPAHSKLGFTTLLTQLQQSMLSLTGRISCIFHCQFFWYNFLLCRLSIHLESGVYA